LYREKHIQIITIANGTAAVMVAVWRALRPPTRSSIAANEAITTPQMSLTGAAGFTAPSADMLPSTKVAESAEVIKKMLTSTSARIEVTFPSGNAVRVSKSDWGRLFAAVLAMLPPLFRSRKIADPPKTVNHRKLKSVGAKSTPKTNCRIVRPREIRAMNVPTKGAQEIHHAQ
jgi:hypothetical protein